MLAVTTSELFAIVLRRLEMGLHIDVH